MTTEEILLITNGLSAIAGLWFWRRSDSLKKDVENLNVRLKTAHKDIADAYESLDKETNKSSKYLRKYVECYQKYKTHRTESAAIINQSAENNAKLALEIEHLKDKLEWLLQDNSATSLALEVAKSDRQKLFEIAKGATDKLAEMNVALEGLEVKEDKDWSKEAFPEMYVIPEGTICVSTIKNNWDAFINEKGTKFKSLQNSIAPYLERIDGKHRKNSYNKSLDGCIDACIGSHELAPLNPLDHPNHPNFRG